VAVVSVWIRDPVRAESAFMRPVMPVSVRAAMPVSLRARMLAVSVAEPGAPPCMVLVSLIVPEVAPVSVFRLSLPQPAIKHAVREPNSHGVNFMRHLLCSPGQLASITSLQANLAPATQTGRDGCHSGLPPSARRSLRSSSLERR
jgi:hypothetical protein